MLGKPGAFQIGRVGDTYKTWDIPIRFLCGLCLPDLKIIQAGEKPDYRQAGFVFPLRLFFTAKRAKKLRPPDRIIRAGKGRKAGQKVVYIILASGIKNNKLRYRFFLLMMMIFSFSSIFPQRRSPTYTVKRLKEAMEIDGDWNKPQWRSVKALHLSHYMGQIPSFRPKVRVKVMYDDDNLYIIFRVKDRFVRSVIEAYNGPVSTDACVEFFFSPDINFPERYFNLEINAGGVPLMGYHAYQQKEHQKFSVEDLKKIEIAHSLPGRVDPQITTPVTWTVEYKLPFLILEKYGPVIYPRAGKTWNANFYKTASKGSNPHYITWSRVNNSKPNFHLPQFFGEIEFN